MKIHLHIQLLSAIALSILACNGRTDDNRVVYDNSSPLYSTEAPFNWKWMLSHDECVRRYPWLYDDQYNKMLEDEAEKIFALKMKPGISVFKPEYINRGGSPKSLRPVEKTIFIGFICPTVTGPMFFLAVDEDSKEVMYAFSESDN